MNESMNYMNGYTAISMLMRGETDRVANENDPLHVWYTWLPETQSLILNKVLESGEIQKELALPFVINQMDKWYHHSGYLPCPICGSTGLDTHSDSVLDNSTIHSITCRKCYTTASEPVWNKRYKWKR